MNKNKALEVDLVAYLVITPIWVFPKIRVPQSGWFIMEHPVKMDDLGVPLFSETPIYIYTHTYMYIYIDIYTGCFAAGAADFRHEVDATVASFGCYRWSLCGVG